MEFRRQFSLAVVLLRFLIGVASQELGDIEYDIKPAVSTTIRKDILTIDLTQCKCVPTISCDLTIIKSPAVDFTCVDTESLCCPATKSFKEEFQLLEDEDTAEEGEGTPNSNVRVYTISAGYHDLSTISKNVPSKLKSKKNCVCKARSSCPHKYIDYGFGFYCTYNTVRCCLPEEEEGVTDQVLASELPSNATLETETEPSTLNNTNFSEAATVAILETSQANLMDTTNSGSVPEDSEESIIDMSDYVITNPASDFKDNLPEGELLITEVTSWDDEEQRSEECFCMSMEKCRSAINLELNTIDRRRDTLCPGDLIQCCGDNVMEEITKKKDDNQFDITPAKQDLPPYQQPIQLPITNTTVDHAPTETKEVTIPPPQLPSQYYNYEPAGYHRGYPVNSYPSQFSGPQGYQKGMYDSSGQNIRPWISLASPSSYSKYAPNRGVPNDQGYPRGSYTNEGGSRSTKPAGLFDTLASMLG